MTKKNKPHKKEKRPGRPHRPLKERFKSKIDYTLLEIFAKEGLTDIEIAQRLGVGEVVINAWKQEDPAFDEALKKGKALADQKVEMNLYKIALADPPMPQTVTAIIFWLKNRKKEQWREKTELEHTGTVKHEMESISDDTLLKTIKFKEIESDKVKEKYH